MKKKKIPFQTCDNCVWWDEHSLLPWDDFIIEYKFQFPKAYDSLIDEELKFFEIPASVRENEYIPSPGDNLKQQKGQWFRPSFSKCPFDYKPNLKIALRRKYKLHCFGCGNTFGCPAEVYRGNVEVRCGECVADDYYYPDEEY